MPITISTLMKREDGTLVDYGQFSERLGDPLYIEGAVVIDCDGAQVLDASMHDLVDQLWAYLIAGAEALQQGQDFTTFFPDQPLELSIRHVGPRLLIATNAEVAREAVVETRAFLRELAVEGQAFFAWLDGVAGATGYAELRARARWLESAVG